MQETEFIKQNKAKWEEFEEVLKSAEKDPERMTDLFIETTDDLSYSRTYYPNRSVRVYLNGLAKQTYQALYKNKNREKNAFTHFWKVDLPQALWNSRKEMLLAGILFFAGILIGMMSSMYYPDFARIMLGDGYIEMTEANIEHGDPMAVYKDEEPISMFLSIAWNNVRIAFGTFILGILFGIGTVYVILFNSIMVGAFLYFFIERGLFRESFLAIMLHGTLELSMIIMAGCAGFALARGLIFPGTYTRGQSLIQSARNGVKIMLAVTVLLIYAALIESFATRHTELPDGIRLLLIILSAALVIGYFILYPRYLYRKGILNESLKIEIPEMSQNIVLNRIKSPGRIFSESFLLFSRLLRPIANLSFAIAIVLTLCFGFYASFAYHYLFDQAYGYWRSMANIYPFMHFSVFLNFESYFLLYPLIAFAFAAMSLLVIVKAHNFLGIPKRDLSTMDWINSFAITCISMLPLLLPHSLTVLVIWYWFPICLFWLYVTYLQNKPFTKTIGSMRQLLKGNTWRLIGYFLSIIAIQWIVYFLLSSDLTFILGQFIQSMIPRNAGYAEEVPYITTTFLLFLLPSLMMSIPIAGIILFYYSAKEINEATTLHEAVLKIGNKKRAYGLEKEQ